MESVPIKPVYPAAVCHQDCTLANSDLDMPKWSSSSHNVRLAYSCTVADKPVEKPPVSTVEVLIGHGRKSNVARQHIVR